MRRSRWTSPAAGPDGKRLPDGGPEQSDDEKFRDFGADEADQMWTYHAVAAAVRAHSFLACAAGGGQGPDRRDRDQLGRLPDVHHRRASTTA